MAFKTPNKTSEFLRQTVGSEAANGLEEIEHFADEHMIPILLPETVNFLAQLVMLKKPKKILEIGTAIGYSGSIMLGACKSSSLITIEHKEELVEIAKKNFEKKGFSDRVTVFCGDAGEILPMLEGSFDFVFLDGPKARYADYLPYILRNMSTGGVLLCDNVLYNGMVAGETETGKKAGLVKRIEEFLELICRDERLITSVLPVGDGMSFSIFEPPFISQ